MRLVGSTSPFPVHQTSMFQTLAALSDRADQPKKTYVLVQCMKGPSLRVAIEPDDWPVFYNLKVFKPKKRGRKPGRAKLYSTGNNPLGALNLEWLPGRQPS
jgi:hypothetical protein